MNTQKQVVDFLKKNPFKSENEIMYEVWGYDRTSTWESNKKYADLIRRALRAGKIKRCRLKYRGKNCILRNKRFSHLPKQTEFVYFVK